MLPGPCQPHNKGLEATLTQMPLAARTQQLSQSDELRRLKNELKRVTEERDILKKAAAYFARQSG